MKLFCSTSTIIFLSNFFFSPSFFFIRRHCYCFIKMYIYSRALWVKFIWKMSLILLYFLDFEIRKFGIESYVLNFRLICLNTKRKLLIKYHSFLFTKLFFFKLHFDTSMLRHLRGSNETYRNSRHICRRINKTSVNELHSC